MDKRVRKKRVFKDFIQNDSPDEDAGCSQGAHDKIRKDKANPSYTSTQRTSLPEPPKKLKRINNPSPLTPPCTSSQRNSMPEPAKKNQIKNPSPPIQHAASTRKTLPEPPKKLQRNKPSPPTPTYKSTQEKRLPEPGETLHYETGMNVSIP
ncbi:serine/arginine repetitive matrix protein 1-like [Epinephelus fuscoguttatus]|uniref:serine/arginine repetitive matrix protein 1-like n=1 Tax=Epinephelus fuscoguttatus TaxID=293821 RepID=UPI0020D125B6|nr:serine/arginine repetitive matrix protein 1-like [Epinephelus fuscoguttatus]